MRSLKRFLWPLLLLIGGISFFACGGGGSQVEGGRPLGAPVVNPNQVNLALRVNVAPRPRQQEILAQGLACVDVIEIRVLDAQSLLEVVDVIRIDPRQVGDQNVTIPGVPVGFRIIRIEGFANPPIIDPGSGLPVAEAGFALDLLLNVQIGAENRATVQVNNNGITGEVVGDGVPAGVAGPVSLVADQPGVSEQQPDVDVVGLRFVIAFRRGGDIFADLFSTRSDTFATAAEDVDGQATGFPVHLPGGNRVNPSVAMDQLLNFSIVWEDLNTADVHGRSFDATANPIAGEELDITISPFFGFDPIRPILGSTTNPNPPPGQGFGGEVRHLLYLGLLNGDAFIGFKTFEPDNMDCDPGVDCPPNSDLIDCACLIVDDLCLALPDPFPFPQPDSNIALGVGQDGFSDLVAFDDGTDIWLFTTRPWVGLNGFDLFKVNAQPGDPGEMDLRFLGFNFSQARDQYAIVYERSGMIFVRTYRSLFGVNEEVAGPVMIGQGTQPRLAAANTDQFYVTWVSPQGEILLDLINHADVSRVSTDPAHLVSDTLVMSGTSTRPRIAASSFGAVVVWEGGHPQGGRAVFQKRFSTGFQP